MNQWVLGAAVVVGLLACGDEPAAEEGTECSTLREEFQAKVWAPTLGKTCITCHQPGGLAWEQRARFSIVPATYPGFVDQNIAALRAMLGYEFEGKPLLLAKPSNMVTHGGGAVLQRDSDEFKDLEAFIERLGQAEDSACAPAAPLPDVGRIGPGDTLRKATLQLVGRLPTEAELASVAVVGDAEVPDESALRMALRAMLDEPEFDQWLITNWNDVLLTDLYGSYTGRSVGLLNDKDFPKAHAAYYDTSDDETKKLATTAVMREPLQLIVHVVRQGLPFSEILTADYMMFNPYSARVYDTDVDFQGATNAELWRPGHLRFSREGVPYEWEHAGLLSSPMILNRFPTTKTNLNRHRAWWVMRTFLATDILTVADRPVDPDKASQFDYPWRQDNQCVVCHAVMDPIAGAWSAYDSGDQERLFPERAPPANVFDPGYGEEVMPPDPSGGRLAWLAKQIAADPRFPLAIARLTFEMVTGRAPIEHPRDATALRYAADEQAWADFDRHMTDATAAFVASKLDYRTLVVELLMGPYFRAEAMHAIDDEGISPEREEELAKVGTARLLTPELLDKKIAATAGVPWQKSDKNRYLLTDFKILYGGIDSDRVTERLVVPNGVMAAVQERMANEVACAATAWDFTKDQGSRLLFPMVAIEDQPTTAGGDEIPAAIERIKANIVHLHDRLLGETLAPGDAEIERTYGLFREVLEAGRAAVIAKTEGEGLRCNAKKDPFTGVDLPEARRVERDPNYTVRAWLAVMSYLLSDYRYLYE